MMLLKDDFVINELPKSAEALQKFIWQINAVEAGHATADVAEETRTSMLLACKNEIEQPRTPAKASGQAPSKASHQKVSEGGLEPPRPLIGH